MIEAKVDSVVQESNMNDFKNSLEYEHKGFPRQDRFYREILKAVQIIRIPFNGTRNKALQRSDIDLKLRFILNGVVKEYDISEKRRSKNFRDIFIELKSFWGNGTQFELGSFVKCTADFLMYFTPTKVYIIRMKALQDFYDAYLDIPLIDSTLMDLYKEYAGTDKGVKQVYVKIGSRSERITAVHSFDREGHDGLGICIPVETLRAHGIEVREYDIPTDW